jgi:hypothetical protein
VKASALLLARVPVLALLVLAAALRPVPAAAAETVITTAFTTGYTYFDNTPPNSNTICCSQMPRGAAGGTGTYADPITLAVGFNNANVMDFPAGTRFYIPHVRRYFIVEDMCVGCHDPGKQPGATVWVDMWVGGTGGDSQAAAQDCAGKLTDSDKPLHTLIQNPPTGLAVVAGPLFQNNQCTAVYGGGAPPPTPPPSTPPPSTPPPDTPPPANTPAPVAAAPTPTSTPTSPAAAATATPDGGSTPSPATSPRAGSAANGSLTPAPPAKTKPVANLIRLGTLAILLLLLPVAGAGWLLRRRSRPRVDRPGQS